MRGDWRRFEAELDAFLAEARAREPHEDGFRLGFAGIPPMVADLYDVFAARGAYIMFLTSSRGSLRCREGTRASWSSTWRTLTLTARRCAWRTSAGRRRGGGWTGSCTTCRASVSGSCRTGWYDARRGSGAGAGVRPAGAHRRQEPYADRGVSRGARERRPRAARQVSKGGVMKSQQDAGSGRLARIVLALVLLVVMMRYFITMRDTVFSPTGARSTVFSSCRRSAAPPTDRPLQLRVNGDVRSFDKVTGRRPVRTGGWTVQARLVLPQGQCIRSRAASSSRARSCEPPSPGDDTIIIDAGRGDITVRRADAAALQGPVAAVRIGAPYDPQDERAALVRRGIAAPGHRAVRGGVALADAAQAQDIHVKLRAGRSS